MKNISLLILSVLFSAGCANCGPECIEARKPKEAYITNDCKVTLTGRECKEKKKEENTQPAVTP